MTIGAVSSGQPSWVVLGTTMAESSMDWTVAQTLGYKADTRHSGYFYVKLPLDAVFLYKEAWSGDWFWKDGRGTIYKIFESDAPIIPEVPINTPPDSTLGNYQTVPGTVISLQTVVEPKTPTTQEILYEVQTGQNIYETQQKIQQTTDAMTQVTKMKQSIIQMESIIRNTIDTEYQPNGGLRQKLVNAIESAQDSNSVFTIQSIADNVGLGAIGTTGQIQVNAVKYDVKAMFLHSEVAAAGGAFAGLASGGPIGSLIGGVLSGAASIVKDIIAGATKQHMSPQERNTLIDQIISANYNALKILYQGLITQYNDAVNNYKTSLAGSNFSFNDYPPEQQKIMMDAITMTQTPLSTLNTSVIDEINSNATLTTTLQQSSTQANEKKPLNLAPILIGIGAILLI